LYDHHAGEHQDAAEQVSRTEPLVQHQVAGQGGEYGFEAHDDSRVCGRGGSLADDLEREGDARREDAGVENRDRGRDDGGESRLFEQDGSQQTQRRTGEELDTGDVQRIGPLGEIVDQQHVGGPEERTDQDEQVASSDCERFRDAQQVQTGYCQHRAHPNRRATPMPKEQTHDRDEHHVKAGDEAGLAGGCIDESHLLHGCAAEQGQTRQDASPQQERVAPAAMGLPIQMERQEHREERHRTHSEARGVEHHGTQVFHRSTLGDKRRAPEERRDEQQQVALQCLCLHGIRSIARAEVAIRGAIHSRRLVLGTRVTLL